MACVFGGDDKVEANAISKNTEEFYHPFILFMKPRPIDMNQMKSQTNLLSEFGFENILHLIPTAVYCCDNEGNILFYNQKAAELWGRSPNMGDVIEKFCGSYKIYTLDGRYLPNDQCPMAEAIIKRLPALNGEIIIERPDRSWVYAKANIYALKDENGEIIGAINSLVDVSAERALSQAYEATLQNFRFLADFIPQLVWMANSDGEVDYYNQSWLCYSGLSLEALKKDGWTQLAHPEDLSLLTHQWAHSVNSCEPFNVTVRLQKGLDQSYRWFLIRAFPLKNDQGQIIRWFGTCTDIHDQKQYEEELKRSQNNLKDFLENSNIGIHWVNSKGIIIYANKAELDLVGYTKEEYIGRHIAEFHADRPVIEDILKRLLAHELLDNYEARLKCKDGTLKDVLINSSVLWENNKFIHTRCFTRDVTRQKRAEQELQERNEKLLQTNEELIRINNQLDTFIYTASHDLKAPISNIEGLVSQLAKQVSQEVIDPAKLHLTLSYIHTSIHKFKTTIKDLTEITRIQKSLENPLDVDQINLLSLVEEITYDMADVIKNTEAVITTNFDGHPTIRFSKTHLKSVLYNLISNGIKYRDLQRSPLIHLQTEIVGDELVLSVSDNGLGFEEHVTDQLFILFKRFHTHVEGSGMGLYIVKKIIDTAKGRIEVESQKGVGSTFKLYFSAQLTCSTLVLPR